MHSNGKASYSVTDVAPFTPTSYYRLRQIETAGEEKISEQKQVQFDGIGLVTIAPNPAYDRATIQVNGTGAGPAMLTVSDNSRRLVQERTVQLKQGPNQLEINGLDKLSPGVYIVTLRSQNQVINKLLIIGKK